MEERCVYVKETVLSELEREKRGLRWQLARAAKLAESRAADVTACESKVKDLLTIVEMNKSVADRAVKRTYMQESQLQRVVFERDDLQLRLAAHRQRCMERGLRGLEQRIVRRLARETLRTLALRATRSRRLRAAWCRMTQLLSPPRVANAFQKWKHVCAPDAGRVHPSALTTHPTASAAEALATTRFPTEFLYDECFRLRFQRRRERTRVAFFAWKTAWVLGSRKHRLAVHWFGAQLSRRVLRAWRHRVQSTQRLRAALKRVATRSVRQIVRAWSSVARRGAQRRRVLGRVLRSHRRQLLRRALTGLCLRCVERNAVEWAHALTTAHQALEEEKVMFALHQDAALKELHASLAEQEQSTRRFQAAHSRALLLARCHAQLRQRFLTWRAQLTRRRLLASVAKRFHRAQHRMRLCRRHFVAWMRLGVARARVRRCVARATLKRRCALLSRVFEAFAAHVRRANARKRRLRALASRVRRVWLLRSWSRWQQSFLVGEHRVSAELETHELVQRMQQQQLRWQSAFARAEKLRRQLQLQYALRMRDARATRGLGERFRRWAARSWAASLRRRALSRVAERCRTQALRLGVARWRQQALAYERLARTLDARASTRRHQRLRTGLATWRRVVTQRALARWNAQRQRLFFAAWRDARARQRERAAAFCRFLRRRVALGWQAQALHTWRRRSEAAAHRERSRDRLRRELAERAWRHWSAFVTARLRLRCRQGDLVQSRLREQQRLTTQRGEFQCWKLLSQRERRQLGLASLAAARFASDTDEVDALDFVGLRSAQKAALRRRVDWATVSQILVERAQERADEMRLQTQRLRAAWLTMRAAQSTERLRARAAFVIAKLWRRHWLRSQWNVWKRRARLETHEAVARSHQQSLALVTTVMGALVHRRHGRHRQRHCFVAWKQRAAAMKRVRGVWGRLIGQREELSLRTRFQDWKVHAGRSRALRSRLTCILSRRLRVATCVAFHRWKCEAIRRLYAGQLETTRMELQSQGVAVAKHVARAMYSTWKHPCLSSCFTQWRIRIRDARHAVKHKLARCLDRRRTRHIVAVLRAWRRFVALQRTVRLLWSNAVTHSHRKLLSAVFVRWRADATTATTLTRGLSRAVDALRRWQLRRGFRQLEASDRDARRRESVKIVVAAQTALQQAKQRHVVKSVALLLRWKQSKSRAHAFALWTAAVAAKQQLRAVVGATRRRHERRALRRLLSAWRRVTKGQRCSRSRVRKLRVAWTQRRVWRCWHSFAARSRQLKRLVYATLVEQQAQAAVHSAWRAWKRFVRLAIAESEQRAAQSLEGRNEQLLLESIGLKKQLRELRRRQLMQFGSTLATVVTASNAARAFDKWRRHGRLARVLQCVLDARRLRHTADAFREWRATTDALRAAAAFAQHRAAAVATALVAKAQTQKRQALWAWKAAAARQRAGKKRAVLLLMATKAGDRLVARCCLASWKALTARRREARARADNMRLRTERRMLHCCYSRWRRLRAATRCRQGGVQLLALAVGCRYRRLVARSWGHWRAHVADAVVTLAHAKLAVLELEHWNATCRHGLDQLLARAMAHWKAVATTARARRRARALAFQELQLGGLRRRCFLAWRDQLPMRRRVLHPVLCVRTSLRRHRGGRPLFCAYNEYRRKLQSGWRLSTTRAALRRRVARGCALALLLRALRRPHRRVLRRALWRWFAKAQRISSTLAAVSFRALPWRTPTTSVAGSMLLLALEELHHLQQAFGLEQRAKSLQLLELLARRFRRQHLRRALDRMRVARDTATTAAARAFVARVGAALVGRAFRTWKAQYIEDALRSAEAAQLELMRALRDVASYRHALDPYAVPY
ncbi:hypothetical protein PybrP1_003254 [[Pythium] brassicae (nom. inval.)]|nr:hypothetical protein PybrP1_003254 [[Pythium] brassicae (nom. inval.)]